MAEKKRFYKTVGVAEYGSGDDAGFTVQLDGRDVKSPAGTLAVLPSRALAGAVAAEWDAQTDSIDASTMPVFSLAVTVLDRVTPQREAIVAELRTYGGNDLLCYQDGDDDDLASRQARQWGPWIDWARDTLGADLFVATGIMPVAQTDASLDALEVAIASHDDWQLGMLHRATTLGGSLVLGLAMLRGAMDADTLFETAFLDELWQTEKWGSDWEAEDRRALLRGEIDQAHRFLAMLSGEEG